MSHDTPSSRTTFVKKKIYRKTVTIMRDWKYANYCWKRRKHRKNTKYVRPEAGAVRTALYARHGTGVTLSVRQPNGYIKSNFDDVCDIVLCTFRIVLYEWAPTGPDTVVNNSVVLFPGKVETKTTFERVVKHNGVTGKVKFVEKTQCLVYWKFRQLTRI